MVSCAGVKDTFKDPVTHIVHPCKSVCYENTPELSPIDCSELCPEYYQCLLKSKEPTTTLSNVVTLASSTLHVSQSGASVDPDPLLIAVLTVSIIVVGIITPLLLCIIIRNKRRRERFLEGSRLPVGSSLSLEPLARPGTGEGSLVISVGQNTDSLSGINRPNILRQHSVSSQVQGSLSWSGQRVQHDTVSRTSRDSGHSVLAPSPNTTTVGPDGPQPVRLAIHSFHFNTSQDCLPHSSSSSHIAQSASIATQTSNDFENMSLRTISGIRRQAEVIEEEPMLSYPVQESEVEMGPSRETNTETAAETSELIRRDFHQLRDATVPKFVH